MKKQELLRLLEKSVADWKITALDSERVKQENERLKQELEAAKKSERESVAEVSSLRARIIGIVGEYDY